MRYVCDALQRYKLYVAAYAAMGTLFLQACSPTINRPIDMQKAAASARGIASTNNTTVTVASPNAATSVTWVETSPYNNTAVTATWTVSTTTDLTNQKLQFYSDSSCSTTSGGVIDLSSAVTNSYSFTGTNGTTYTYRVRSFDSTGNATNSDCSSSMTIDTTAPTVTGLANDATPTQSKSWTWGCSEASCTYRYVIDTTNNTAPAGAYGATISDTQATGTGTYYIHVQAKDSAGNESAVVHVSAVLDNSAPTVTGLTNDATPTQSKTWTWGCSEASCTYRYTIDTTSNTSPSGAFGATTTATQSSGTGTYYIHVQAMDTAGNLSAVVHVSAVIDNSAPTVTGLSNDTTPRKSKTWTWGCSETNCTYHYVIDTTSNTTPGTAYGSTITDSQSSGDGTYYIHVQAKDEAGNTSAVVSVSALIDNTAPTAPSSVNDASYMNSLTSSTGITWTGSTDTNGVDHYEYAIGTTSGGTDVVSWTTTGGTSTSITVTGLSLTSGTTYYFSVRAVDQAGNVSSVGNGDGWIADTTPPGAPTGVTLGAVPNSLTTSPTISWTAPADASGINYYDVQLYKASDNSVVQTWTTSTSGTALSSLSLTAGTDYYVKVRAIDNAGNTGTSYGQSANWTAVACTAGSQTFSYTGSDQTFTVPSGCTTIRVKAWGAGGGGAVTYYGGGGGFIDVNLSTTPGESLTVIVGRGGDSVPDATDVRSGHGGGGRSAIQRSGADIATAGGGGGASKSSRGGAGGSNTGEAGPTNTVTSGGGGGTQAAGGAAGSGAVNGTAGSQYLGGHCDTSGIGGGVASGYQAYGGGGAPWTVGSGTRTIGGSGGGGYYGGGGGGGHSTSTATGGAGGGGGSSYASGATTNAQAATDGTGAAAGTGDADYSAGIGSGGQNGVGGNGKIVISY